MQHASPDAPAVQPALQQALASPLQQALACVRVSPEDFDLGA
jgi:hypothetical protein